ncbi:U3 snoRNP protein [Rhizoctonia solani]
MSDGQSNASGNDESAMSENEEKYGAPQPVKAPGVFHAPTTQELVELREGTELFKSNSFKLQAKQLLREVSASESQRSIVEKVLMSLHEHLINLPSIAPCRPPSTIKKRTAVPYPAPLPSQDSQWTVSFEPPSNIQLVGSWANGVAVRGNDKTGFSVDLAVEIPSSLLREKDYLNARYFHQRAYYLAIIASSLSAKGNPLGLTSDDLLYESLEHDIRRTTLVILPTKDSSSDLARSKFPLSIRIIPVLPSNNPLSERHLGPGRACIRTSGLSDLDPAPTPLYNNSVLLSTTPVSHLLLIHNAKSQIPAFGDTLALLRVWANQRGYGTGTGHRLEDSAQHARCVRGFGFLGAWWSAIIVYLVLGGKPVKGVKKQARIGRGLSSYQLFRAVLDFLAKHDFATAPIFLAESPFELADWKEHHDAIFIDGSGKYNMLAGVPLESLEMLKLDAQSSLLLLDESSDEAFEATFLHDLRNPRLRFDYSLRVPLDGAKSKVETLSTTLEWSSRTNALISQLTSIIRKALGTRVKACVVLQPAPTLRPLSQSTPNSIPFVELGLVLDQTEAPRLVDYGPPADDSAGSETFRAFWGPKSELRRFKDGRILESVVWEVTHPDERAHIPGRLIRHILQYHFGIELAPVQRTIYDEVVRLPSSVVKLYSSVAENLMTFRPSQTSFDALVKQIKSAEDLPLALVTASPISPSLRGTSVFYPWPLDIARYGALPDSIKYVPPMEAILQLEKSARWPDDLAAIQKIKLAFFVGIADALRAQDEKIRTAVALDSDATETDIHDNCSLEILAPSGFAFRLRIYHDREKTLLDGIISDTKAAPGVVASAKNALRIHETRFIHTPRHHAAVAALGHRYPSYAPTVRLVVRWLGAHLLLTHISHALVELIVAREFLKPGLPPTSVPTAFARVVQTLVEWRWREEPLAVPLYSALDEQGERDHKKLSKGAEEACRALRGEDPTLSRGAWVVSTEEDVRGLRWGSPKPIVAARVQQIAKATLEHILSHEIIEKTIFLHPLTDYDFIIRLNPSVLPRYGENLAADQRVWTASRGFANNREVSSPLVGFDPAAEYLADLRRSFGHLALFFHDPHGGDIIAGLWDPKPTTQVTPFKVLLGYSTKPTDGGKVVFNKKSAIAEMKLMGEGMPTLLRQMIAKLNAVRQSLRSALDQYLEMCLAIDYSFTDNSSPQYGFELLTNAIVDELELFTSYEKKLSQAKAALGTARNRSAIAVPFSRLPNDILIRIFELVTTEHSCIAHKQKQANKYIVPRYPSLLAHVCSRWRRVVMSSTYLWSHIDIPTFFSHNKETFAGMDEYIAQSGASLLDIHIVELDGLDNPVLTTPGPLTRVLVPLTSRIRSLEIELSAPYNKTGGYSIMLSFFFSNCAPGTLKRLAICLNNSNAPCCFIAAAFSVPKRNITSFGAAAENVISLSIPEKTLEDLWLPITTLELRGVYPRWSSKAYSDLTTLRLGSNGGFRASVSQAEISAILSSSPKLRILDFGLNITYAYSPEEEIKPVGLDDLEVLLTGERTPEQLGRLLCLIAPGSRPLSISLRQSAGRHRTRFSAEVRNFFARANVEVVGMAGSYAYQQVIELQELVPEMRALVFSRINIRQIDWNSVSLGDPETDLQDLYVLRDTMISQDNLLRMVKAHRIHKLIMAEDAKIMDAIGLTPVLDKRTIHEQLSALEVDLKLIDSEEPHPFQEWDWSF